MPELLRRPPRLASGIPAGILALLLLALPAGAEVVQTYQQRTDFDVLPEKAVQPWSRVGDGHRMILEEAGGPVLLLNDNDAAERIAYQSVVGEIEAAHRIRVRARVRVLSNGDGDGALLEVSRPGMEVLVRLRTDRIDVVERLDGRQFRWLGSSPVDLTEYRELEVTKAALDEAGLETVRVAVDGQEILRVRPRGGGGLDVGRVLLGSLSYPSYGATLWQWIDVELWATSAEGSAVSVEKSSVGSLKARWSGR